MEYINVIIDDHGNTFKRSLDEEDGLVWVLNSRHIITTCSKHSAQIEENSDSPSHSNVDIMVTPVEEPLIAHFEACDSEALTS